MPDKTPEQIKIEELERKLTQLTGKRYSDAVEKEIKRRMDAGLPRKDAIVATAAQYENDRRKFE